VGRKRGRHVRRIEEDGRMPYFDPERLFFVHYTSSKCKHAKLKTEWITALDELDAYQRFKKGAN
jgi:hypothetical protein